MMKNAIRGGLNLCEQLCPEDLLKNDIDSLIKHCLKVEQDRKLSVVSCLCGLRAFVRSFPLRLAFPTSEYYA